MLCVPTWEAPSLQESRWMHQWGHHPRASLPRRAASQIRPSCNGPGCLLLSAMHLLYCARVALQHHTAQQHSTTQHDTEHRPFVGMLASTGPACASTVMCCPAAVIPTMACCYRPSHGVPWCGIALSQSVSRDLSPSLPLGRWVGGCTNWDAGVDLGCVAGPASLQPSRAQTSDGDLSSATTTSTRTISKVCCKIRRT